MRQYNIHKIIFSVLSLMLVANGMKADDSVTGSFVGPSTDNQWTLDVNLTNDGSYSAFQMDITLPAGLSVVSATPVASRLSQSGSATIDGETVEAPFIVTFNLIKEEDNTVRITAYNIGNNAITGQSGYPVLKLLLQADSEKEDSDMVAYFSNVDFIKVADMADNTLKATNADAELLGKYLKITAQKAGSTAINQTGTVSATLQYGTATEGWQDYSYDTDIALAEGNSAWFRAKGTDGKNGALSDGNNYLSFSSTSDISASQNIMSLLDASCTQTTLPDYAFMELFENCTHLTQAPELPAMTLSNGCYARMFMNCTSLKTTPALPATSLALDCYYYMFCGCTSLTSIPDLSHATISGSDYSNACNYMFGNCTSLRINTIGPGTEWKSPTYDGTSADYHLASMFALTGGNLASVSYKGTYGTYPGTPQKDVTYYIADKPYTRSMTNKWGTIVLPFDVAISDADPYDFYQLSAVLDNTLTLTKMTSKLPAGTPAILRMSESSKDAETDKYELSMTIGDIATTSVKNPSAVNGLTLTGTYTNLDITDNDGYIIANNAFWNIADIKGANKVYCSPFRAWLSGSISSGAKQLTIGFDDDTPTAVETINAITTGTAEYYDINGRKLSDLQQGINILKFKNGTTKKVIIK